MLFTLEALQAKHGDSLILHYGKPKTPKMIVIDGGPAGVYKASLKPRLNELKESRSPDEALSIRMLMVSHLDDDHINGVLAFLDDLADKQDQNQEIPYNIVTLWHNSFDDIIGSENDADELMAASLHKPVKPIASGGAMAAGLPVSLSGSAIAASVPQGRDVRNIANKLGLSINTPFEKLVQAPVKGKKVVPIGDGLKFTVIGPLKDRIEELQLEWNTVIKAKGLAKNEKGQALAAAFLDESVFNLSSICVLAEAGGKTMLLTGDARGDHVLKGLTGAGLLKKGTMHVDLLKLPHHGSDRNVETDFFRQITADHYVISADGRHGNPEVSTLQMISEARGKDKYTVHLTNRESRLTKFFAAEKKKGKKYDVVFRDDKEFSLWVDLGDDALED
ncbi:MAG TPA: hypothetical protein VFX97_10220 [Pyrinomonadaceae bacterium]|nr:hypothetical protein [Pyrinomonadaceae bacterium]